MTEEFLKVAKEAAREAGAVLLSYYGKSDVFEVKKDSSRLTEADLSAERSVIDRVKKSFPTHSILSEEKGFEEQHSNFLWIIDPLDGTTNFSNQVPFFCTSIGLFKDGKPFLGVVYYPHQDELFWATAGGGSWLNDKPIHVVVETDMETGFLAMGTERTPESKKRAACIYSIIKPANTHIRTVGASALELCYVACGRFSAFLLNGNNAWDVAAGALIAKESGAHLTDYEGEEWSLDSKTLLASSPVIAEELLSIVKRCKKVN